MIVNIGRYIYQELSSISGLTVFPVVAPFDNDTPTTPIAVYQRTSMEPIYTKSLWTGDIKHYYSLSVMSTDYDRSAEIAQLAIDAIMSLSYTLHQDIRFGQVTVTGLSEDFSEGIFIQSIQIVLNTQKL